MTTPKIYACEPIEVKLEPEKIYSFCICGYSEKSPFCDGAHKEKCPNLKSHKFSVEKEGKYWLCQCKKTKNPPFCDGSHKDLK
ncbi:MAG: CDGSH iron-sulfur domain-containing protein [Alphaproteobacteria bacterium]|nr:CDGSH iron-sulfur domain-containing protein [Alphaproteobacteria bacterium]